MLVVLIILDLAKQHYKVAISVATFTKRYTFPNGTRTA